MWVLSTRTIFTTGDPASKHQQTIFSAYRPMLDASLSFWVALSGCLLANPVLHTRNDSPFGACKLQLRSALENFYPSEPPPPVGGSGVICAGSALSPWSLAELRPSDRHWRHICLHAAHSYSVHNALYKCNQRQRQPIDQSLVWCSY